MEPNEYVGIAMWHGHRATLSLWINYLQRLAASGNAPLDVIYKTRNEWVRVEDLSKDHPFRIEFAKAVNVCK